MARRANHAEAKFVGMASAAIEKLSYKAKRARVQKAMRNDPAMERLCKKYGTYNKVFLGIDDSPKE